MKNNNIIIKDIDFDYSNVSIELEHKNTEKEDDLKTVVFDLKITYEDKIINEEFVLFSNEIDKLNSLTGNLDQIDFYFYEPNISFTVFENISKDIVLYINIDSGLKVSNSPSDSGLSIRLEGEKPEFIIFINQIKYYLTYER